MTWYWKRPRNKIYIVSQRRQIPGDKTKNAQKTYEKLLRRKEVEGETPWILDALKKATARLTKMGISNNLWTKAPSSWTKKWASKKKSTKRSSEK